MLLESKLLNHSPPQKTDLCLDIWPIQTSTWNIDWITRRRESEPLLTSEKTGLVTFLWCSIRSLQQLDQFSSLLGLISRPLHPNRFRVGLVQVLFSSPLYFFPCLVLSCHLVTFLVNSWSCLGLVFSWLGGGRIFFASQFSPTLLSPHPSFLRLSGLGLGHKVRVTLGYVVFALLLFSLFRLTFSHRGTLSSHLPFAIV